MKTALVLFGATASGKTAALSRVFREHPDLAEQVELLSADSRQVYRWLDIGTAKPSGAERTDPPLHLVDFLDPREAFDLGTFVHACDQLVPEIRRRNRLPVITGGTAFYIKGYLYGLPETPPASVEVREQLRKRAHTDGLHTLRDELLRVDPESARRIGENDEYRILRALEVFRSTGRPRSAFTEPHTVRPGLDVLLIGLRRDREDLYRRINARVEAMFEAGLPREVEEQYRRGYRPEDPGLRTIGYREFFEIDHRPPWSPESLPLIRDRIARNTRHYARRQEIFFRQLPEIRWIDAEDTESLAVAIEEAIQG